ncbi:hypothetical protein ElyMa_006895100 [Elysia marginata]|uniref:Reverse transcriptase domain-containing protein n=1 Tax=Elysia marginata TaxID=1093978 RepID=A0AAV4JEE7_9GAST|nr:hypothetical protein ElyMa_006895100 [Elysia marginata]
MWVLEAVPQDLKDFPPSISSRGNEVASHAIITEEYHSSALRGKSWPGSSSAGLSPALSKNCYQKGCVLAPTLFSMMFSVMLTNAFNAETPGIDIRYRTDGKLYNPRRLHAKTKVHTRRLRDFLFADDCALNAGNEADMQHSMDSFSTACDNFSLSIRNKKTEVMYQPAPGKPYPEPTMTVNGVKLAAVDRLTYLGSTLSHNIHIDDENDGHIAKASPASGGYNHRCGNAKV